jgi:hypothetical protein
MPRYKGRTSAKDIEKAFPHIVEMIVPLGDFGKARRWARGIQADAVAIESKRTVEIDRFADRKEVDEYFTNLIGPARRWGLIEVI